MTHPSNAADILASNLARVRERIDRAAADAGRDRSGIVLVCVSKYVDASLTALLATSGELNLGESRPQQLWEKAGASGLQNARWHLIGHLQRNKAKRTVPLTALIHSVDSTRLLRAIDSAAAEAGSTAEVLLEVNCSGDAEKHGLDPDGVRAVLAESQQAEHVQVRGLMTMAAREGGPAEAQRNFASLRELRDELLDAGSAPEGLPHLSMGMTGDLEAAVAEGSTILRVGSALWDGLRG
ncbi:MAG: YggS family pyridoxal phosphate-dependent enzyme [Planctomycetota bacterium]